MADYRVDPGVSSVDLDYGFFIEGEVYDSIFE